MRKIAIGFRLNFMNRSMVIDGNARTQYSPNIVRTPAARAATAQGTTLATDDELAHVHTNVATLLDHATNTCDFFDSDPIARKVRLCTGLQHLTFNVGNKNKRCQLCSKRAIMECMTCGVHL